MIRSALVCKDEHFWLMDTKAFNDYYSNTPLLNDRYDNVSVIFVTIDDGIGDYCMLEEGTLHLVLHIEPSYEAMIEAFERNFFEPVGA